MTAEADRSWQATQATRFWDRLRRGAFAFFVRTRKAMRWLWERLPFRYGFSSLTRRIVVLNLIGLAILVSGILYLNQFRAGLIDAKVQSLLTQGEIIAGALDQRRLPTRRDGAESVPRVAGDKTELGGLSTKFFLDVAISFR